MVLTGLYLFWICRLILGICCDEKLDSSFVCLLSIVEGKGLYTGTESSVSRL